MRVVVTGGAGFIGANLSRALVASGAEVVALDNFATSRKENLEGIDVEVIEGTILDPSTLDAVFRGADSVVHLAARPSVPRSLADPVASHVANATGTVEVLEAARRERNVHVVVASSSSVYGANRALPKHEGQVTLPMSPYAASKLATEAYALAYQHSYGLPVLAFRFFNVFGPMQAADHAYAAVVPAFASAALAGRPLVVHGDGRQSRDFTFVGTVAEVITEAVHRQVTHPEAVNLAFGSRIDVLTLAQLIADEVGVPLDIEFTEPRRGDARHTQADATRLRELFPDIVPVEMSDALRETIAWLRTERDTR